MQFVSHLLVFGTLFIHCVTDAYIQNSKQVSSKEGHEKPSTLSDVSRAKNQSKAKNRYPKCGPEPECPKSAENPKDCCDILCSGKKESGVYTIWPRYLDKSLNVYCDMDTNGGGWTVIQRRGGEYYTYDYYFYRDWNSYKRGFGSIAKEFWMGNDNINAITNQDSYKIRFDLKDTGGNEVFAEYDAFRIDDETTNYTLHIDIESFKGSAGDSMFYSEGREFFTQDRDSYESCALKRMGAWWYSDDCGDANLNGVYIPGVNSSIGCAWPSWNDGLGLLGVEIKLRPD